MAAASEGHLDVVKILSPISKKKDLEQSLKLAEKRNYTEIIEILKKEIEKVDE